MNVFIKDFIEKRKDICKAMKNISITDIRAKEALLIVAVAIYLLGMAVSTIDVTIYAAVCAAAYKKMGLAVAIVVAYDIKKHGRGPKIQTLKVMPKKGLRRYAYLIAALTFVGYMLLDVLPVMVVTWGYMYSITLVASKMAKEQFD